MDSSSEGNGALELKFRIFDGTDIGHGTYSSSITAAALKQKLLSVWPRDKSVVPESVNGMKVIHGGKVMENGKTLADSGLHVGGEVITMHVVVQPSAAKKKKAFILMPSLAAYLSAQLRRSMH